MIKVPIIGEVKTRLSEQIGYHHSLELYKSFLMDIIDRIKPIDTPKIIYYTPEKELDHLTHLLGTANQYVPQKGINLGQRLLNGFKHAEESGYKSAIALATDIPDIPREVIEQAISYIEKHDAVIGPSPDGGYYLLGLNRGFIKDSLFTGIEWGTDSVFPKTLKKLQDENINVKVLQNCMDIDNYYDLEYFYNNTRFRDSRTFRYLQENIDLLTKPRL
jgi:hypothetical protein